MNKLLKNLVSDSKNAKIARIILYVLLAVMGVDLFVKISPYVFYIDDVFVFGGSWDVFLDLFNTTTALFIWTVIELIIWTALLFVMVFGFAYNGKYIFAVGINTKRFPRRYIVISVIVGLAHFGVAAFVEYAVIGAKFFLELEYYISFILAFMSHLLVGGGCFFLFLFGGYLFAESRRNTTGYYVGKGPSPQKT